MLKPSSWIAGAKRLVRGVVRRVPLLRHAIPTPGSQPVETEPPAVTAPHESAPGEGPSPAAGPTFCIHPWTRLKLLPDGSASVCCAFRGKQISRGDSIMSLEGSSLEEIWNSDDMRAIRRDMVEGRQVAGCGQCYEDEAAGGISIRVRDNADWEQGRLNDDRTTPDQLKALAASNDYRLPTLPLSLEIETGSLCNLKCRMCNDTVSSQIARDRVHSSWTADQWTGAPYHDPTSTPRSLGINRFSILKSALRTELLTHPGQIRRLYFIGGEPTLVRGVKDVLQGLIEAERSRDIELAVVSNGTIARSWLSLAQRFKRLELAVSIDGYDTYYDYIRYPAHWAELAANLDAFKRLDGVQLGTAVTLQAYNALNITDLFRYLDSIDVGFWAYPIYVPKYLAVWVLPPAIRRVAAERLRAYADGDCRPHHRDMVRGLADQLQSNPETFDARLLRDFMRFTNDLDASRGQSFRDVHRELFDLMAEEGIEWSHETVHAS